MNVFARFLRSRRQDAGGPAGWKPALLVLLLAAPLPAAELPKWIAGSWKGKSTEEHWTAAKGGVMLGVNRTITSKGKTSFEFLRIEQRGDDVFYVAQPGGQPPTSFKLVRSETQRVVFENREHDFPQRILYWRSGAKLCARVEGTIDGKDAGEEWCWARGKLTE